MPLVPNEPSPAAGCWPLRYARPRSMAWSVSGVIMPLAAEPSGKRRLPFAAIAGERQARRGRPEQGQAAARQELAARPHHEDTPVSPSGGEGILPSPQPRTSLVLPALCSAMVRDALLDEGVVLGNHFLVGRVGVHFRPQRLRQMAPGVLCTGRCCSSRRWAVARLAVLRSPGRLLA